MRYYVQEEDNLMEIQYNVCNDESVGIMQLLSQRRPYSCETPHHSAIAMVNCFLRFHQQTLLGEEQWKINAGEPLKVI